MKKELAPDEHRIFIPVDADAAGLIRENDHVDIMATVTGKNGRATTVLVARDLVVIDAPTERDSTTNGYVFKTTDREWASIKSAIATSGSHSLLLGLRPSNSTTTNAD